MLSLNGYSEISELEQLYAEDQAELRADPKREKHEQYIKAQMKRIEKTEKTLISDKIFSSNAYYSAAMLFQHGEEHNSSEL